MKKIINGRVYDTDTAKKLATWSNNLPRRDIDWCEESLYRKKNGEFFLDGDSGPRGKYAERFQGGWIGGSAITPLTYDEARRWAEEKLDADEYEEIFGAITEDASRTSLNLSMSTAAAETAKRAAAQAGLTVSAYIERLILNA